MIYACGSFSSYYLFFYRNTFCITKVLLRDRSFYTFSFFICASTIVLRGGNSICWTLCCRACYGVLRFVMESGAKGCEVGLQKLLWPNVFWIALYENFVVISVWLEQVIVSGKLRAQRAKSMKFKDGYMISSGQPVKDYIDSAVRHVLLRQVCCYSSLSDTIFI